MSLPRRVAGWLLAAIAAILLTPFAYFGIALLGAVIPGSHTDTSGAPQTRIALARGPIHYDLLLPATDTLRTRFAFATAQGVPVLDPRVEYLMVGWGSKAFYTNTGTYADLNLASIWPAITGDDATLHLDVTGDIAGVPGITWIDLSQTQLQALEAAIAASLTRDAAGQPIPLQAPPFGPTDAFYAAEGHFNAFTTCNVWIGERLREAGLPFGSWTPTPHAVALSARWFTPTQP